MKQILISIKPKWVVNILVDLKTLEIRKTAPNEWEDYLNDRTTKKPEPMTVFIYCTKGDYIGYLPKRYIGKVVARFTLNDVYAIYNEIFVKQTGTKDYFAGRKIDNLWSKNIFEHTLLKRSCLLYGELDAYLKGKIGYAWRIDGLKIFGEPKELSEFKLTRAPQSWCYVEELL